MRIGSWLPVVAVALVLPFAGPPAMAQTDKPVEISLTCTGSQEAANPDEPTIYFRLDLSITGRELKNRWLGVSRYTDSFRKPKPEDILETISRRGEIDLIPCDDPEFPGRCTNQRPAVRTLLVSQMARDPLYVAGYMTCAFCPLAPIIVQTNDDDGLEFRYFENNLVTGTCKQS